MEISEIMENHCKGKYVVQILAGSAIKEFEFNNLLDAIDYTRQLTFRDCKKMIVEKTVDSYDIWIYVKTDCLKRDCRIVEDNDDYPYICNYTIWRHWTD